MNETGIKGGRIWSATDMYGISIHVGLERLVSMV